MADASRSPVIALGGGAWWGGGAVVGVALGSGALRAGSSVRSNSSIGSGVGDSRRKSLSDTGSAGTDSPPRSVVREGAEALDDFLAMQWRRLAPARQYRHQRALALKKNQEFIAPGANSPNLPPPERIALRPPPMADKENRYALNIAGAFYVDDQCIDCDLCRETAPANFKRDDDGGHSYVYKQPENDDERKLCEEALAGCPVEAIGSDGDQ